LYSQALDSIARSDKELQNFELSDDEWNIIDEVVSVLMVSKLFQILILSKGLTDQNLTFYVIL
jgi:phosphatidylglycerophosphatase A